MCAISYFLLFSRLFLLILGLKLKMPFTLSKSIHLAKHSISSRLNFPVPFTTLFTPNLFLLSGFFLCQHKHAPITPYTIQIAALLSFFSLTILPLSCKPNDIV